MIEQSDLSEHRACKLAGLSRDSIRHPPERDQLTKVLSGKIIEIARIRRHLVYRRIHDLLRPEFPAVNPKQVYRRYSATDLAALAVAEGVRSIHGYALAFKRMRT